MAFPKIQSVVAQLSVARYAYEAATRNGADPVAEEAFRKTNNELMLAGLREVAGHDGVHLADSPSKGFDSKPLTITVTAIDGGRPSFGPKLAGVLNDCRKWHWRGNEGHLLREAMPSDDLCVRSEWMVMHLLTHLALDHCNVSPDEVLDPITPEDMKAFGVPNGLLAPLWPG